MKKPSERSARDRELASLKLRVAHLERTTAALSARMLSLFGPVVKHAEPVVVGTLRPVIAPAVR